MPRPQDHPPLCDEPDNPDQRIAEDVWLLAEKSLTLFFSFINNVAKLSAFVAILWVSSGVHPVSVGGVTVMVHGYLVGPEQPVSPPDTQCLTPGTTLQKLQDLRS